MNLLATWAPDLFAIKWEQFNLRNCHIWRIKGLRSIFVLSQLFTPSWCDVFKLTPRRRHSDQPNLSKLKAFKTSCRSAHSPVQRPLWLRHVTGLHHCESCLVVIAAQAVSVFLFQGKVTGVMRWIMGEKKMEYSAHIKHCEIFTNVPFTKHTRNIRIRHTLLIPGEMFFHTL